MTVAALWLVLQPVAMAQAVGVLRITVTLAGADEKPAPVPRHLLLVSDNPASTVPRRVVTAADGTATVRLLPGNYTVESDRAVVFQGREYQWTQTLDVPAGETTLELTAANAEVGRVSGTSASGPADRPADATDVLLRWQQSVVALWTPTTHASGVVIDARGLVVTNQQVVGAATTVEVQLTPVLKVRGAVLAADRASDVAVVRIDPAAVASIAPVPLGCTPLALPTLVNGQEVVALGTAMGQHARSTEGPVQRVASRTMIAELSLPRDSAGGPVFTITGQVVGITSFIEAKEGDPDDDSRIVRVDAVCEVVAAAERQLAAAAPSGAPLPVEPTTLIPEETLKEAARLRAGSLSPYLVQSAAFDITFLTPVVTYAGLQTMDFSNWSQYVYDMPPVLFVRVTPKQEEAVWATIARGMARLKGIALPPIKHFRAGFARLRVLCGDAEVTPIHPFLLERRVSETDAIHEGLYVFDPDAIGPHCAGVTFEAFSEKTPAAADRTTIDPKVLQQIWQDFAPYRALK